MAKRFAMVFFITLAVAVLCVASFVLVLFMAPGMTVFGLKYIQTGTHVVSKHFQITTALEEAGYPNGEFSGSIRVEVDDIPVQVVFTLGWNYEVVYYDNYSGLTLSKIQDPSITCTRDDDGTAVLKVTSFKTFIYENGNSTRYIKLLIPANRVSDSLAGQTDLTIKADKASVSFADEKPDNFDPYFHKISIETAGGVYSSLNLKADTFEYTTLNTITLGESVSTAINATNYILKSTGGKIEINRPIEGDLQAITNNASVKLLSCDNLKINCGWGDVSCSNPEKDIVVNGTANITTTAGRITLGSVLGETGTSIINTKTGTVHIKKIYDAEITTTRGHVFVNSSRNLKTTTSSGAITIEEATASTNVTTKRGKVVLGGENAVVVNPTVQSTFGKVLATSTSGKVSIETTNANVEFTNKDSTEIVLKVGGTLKATKLMGVVDIVVDKNAVLEFADFTENSKIVNNGAGSSMTISILTKKASEFAYALEGTEVKLMEYNVDDPANHRQLEVSTIVTGGQIGMPKLSVTSKGSMVVYCKMS